MKSSPSETSPAQGTSIEASTQKAEELGPGFPFEDPSVLHLKESCLVVETELMRQSPTPPSEVASRPPATFNQ
ncbi:hypothetical protein H5410_057975 [Solanum commersonii]|uniref:Uncharacterized protein n=1 Tax=Solanum commersonii TaxID=4109 RepID=A0A9J5WPP6_SOLCO|nr:hypothetical protein H5410_057975 [Solanum commersonii]